MHYLTKGDDRLGRGLAFGLALPDFPQPSCLRSSPLSRWVSGQRRRNPTFDPPRGLRNREVETRAEGDVRGMISMGTLNVELETTNAESELFFP